MSPAPALSDPALSRSKPVVPTEEPISVPLYVAGLIVTLAGVQAVNSTVEDASFTLMTLLLTCIGFAFSYGSRWMGIQPRVLEFLSASFIAYVVYGVFHQSLSLGVFMPASVADRDMQLAVGLTWVAVIRAWTLSGDEQVLFSSILSIAMIGLVATHDVNAPVQVSFVVFVMGTTFLLMHQTSLQNRARASAAERAREGGGIVAIQAGLAAAVGLCALCLGSVVSVPVQAAFQGLSLGQAVRRLIGAERPGDLQTTGIRFSDDALMEIGAASNWPSSAETVMKVAGGDQQPHYWRGRTYDNYTGAGWESGPGDEVAPLAEAGRAPGRWRRFAVHEPLTTGDPASPGDAAPTWIFTVLGQTRQFYYTGQPRLLTLYNGSLGIPQQGGDGRLQTDGPSLSRVSYAVTCRVAPDPSLPEVSQRLRRAGRRYGPEISRNYLPGFDNGVTTQDDIRFYDEALRQAFQSLRPGRHTPFDKAQAIRDWIAARCVYSLSVDAIAPDTDHVRAFLFDTRRGYCDLFASAMTVLCRQAGIPARLATGFAPGARDGNDFVLRALDKHAWTEVFFPGAGWVAFDATEGSRADSTVPDSRPASRRDWLGWARALLAGGPIPLLLFGGIVVLLAWVVKVEVYDRLRARWSEERAGQDGRGLAAPERARTEIGRRYGRMTRALTGLGLPRRAAETPLEYAARAQAFLEREQDALHLPLASPLVSALTGAFVAARYGGMSVPPPLFSGDAFDHTLSDWTARLARARRQKALQKFRRSLSRH